MTSHRFRRNFLEIFLLAIIWISSSLGAADESKPNVQGSCGGQIIGSNGGTIASPGFPTENYPNDGNCTYEIEVEEGFVILFQSIYFELEARHNSDYCYDYVSVNAGDDRSDVRYCGNETILLDATSGTRLIIVFSSDSATTASGFVITWYKLNPNALTPVFNCDFDGPLPLCGGWNQSKTDDMDVSFTRGTTKSKSTGPTADHTTGSGRYAFLEASDGNGVGQAAILISPEVIPNEHPDYCLEFWYHNLGFGQLYVVNITGVGSGIYIFEVTDDTGIEWQQVQIPVPNSNNPFRIAIEFTRGNSYKSDVAVDDISLHPYACTNPTGVEGGLILIDDIGIPDIQTTASDYDVFVDFTEASTDLCALPNHFVCANDATKCIQADWVCDNVDDCFDGSDERNCEDTTTQDSTTPLATTETITTVDPCSLSNHFVCVSDPTQCIDGNWVCDNFADCADGSDEVDCFEGATTEDTLIEGTLPSIEVNPTTVYIDMEVVVETTKAQTIAPTTETDTTTPLATTDVTSAETTTAVNLTTVDTDMEVVVETTKAQTIAPTTETEQTTIEEILIEGTLPYTEVDPCSLSNHFVCVNDSTQCIDGNWVCDNFADCADGSDEVDCFEGATTEDTLIDGTMPSPEVNPTTVNTDMEVTVETTKAQTIAPTTETASVVTSSMEAETVASTTNIDTTTQEQPLVTTIPADETSTAFDVTTTVEAETPTITTNMVNLTTVDTDMEVTVETTKAQTIAPTTETVNPKTVDTDMEVVVETTKAQTIVPTTETDESSLASVVTSSMEAETVAPTTNIDTTTQEQPLVTTIPADETSTAFDVTTTVEAETPTITTNMVNLTTVDTDMEVVVETTKSQTIAPTTETVNPTTVDTDMEVVVETTKAQTIAPTTQTDESSLASVVTSSMEAETVASTTNIDTTTQEQPLVTNIPADETSTAFDVTTTVEAETPTITTNMVNPTTVDTDMEVVVETTKAQTIAPTTETEQTTTEDIFIEGTLPHTEVDPCSLSNHFVCVSDPTQCIDGNWVCDNFADCADGSDEVDCFGSVLTEIPESTSLEGLETTTDRFCSMPGHFVCVNDSTECIDGGWVCDGYEDCLDGTDEINCTDKELQNSTPAITSPVSILDSTTATNAPHIVTTDFPTDSTPAITSPVSILDSTTATNVTTDIPTVLTLCQQRHRDVLTFIKLNPDIQDGPILPNCTEDGAFTPRQCNGFTLSCWCVNTTTGVVIEGTVSLPDKGFHLDCQDVNVQSCGGNFTNSSSVIRSPNFPDMYTQGCSYNIMRSDQMQYIEINLLVLNLGPRGPDGSCTSDRLEFVDGSNYRYSVCGFDITEPLKFETDVSFHLVHGDYNSPKKGFNLSYKLERCDISEQIYQRQTSSCDKTCDDLQPVCFRNVVSRCACPPHAPVLHNESCIVENDCPEVITTIPSTMTMPTQATTATVYMLDIELLMVKNYTDNQACLLVSGGKDATLYHFSLYRTAGSEFIKQHTLEKDGNKTMYEVCIGKLMQDTNYTVEVWSTVDMNTGPTKTITFKTGFVESTTSSSPIDLQVRNLIVANSTLNQACLSYSTSVDVEFVHIILRSVDRDVLLNVSFPTSGSKGFCVNDLSTGTTYIAQVQASTSNKEFGSFNEVQFTTLDSSETTTMGGMTTLSFPTPIAILGGATSDTSTTPMLTTTRSENTSLEVNTINIDQSTVCFKIKHIPAADRYLVTLDPAEDASDEGVSEMFDEIVATSPFTYACFYDLKLAKSYVPTVVARQGIVEVDRVKSNVIIADNADFATTAQSPVYQQTEATRQWQISYNTWRNETLNNWYTILSEYLKVVGEQLSGMEPDNSKCPDVFKPRCETTLKNYVDFNGCLFFICEAPPTGGDLTHEDVIAWEKENQIFKDYLMPQWQEVFKAYSEAAKQN